MEIKASCFNHAGSVHGEKKIPGNRACGMTENNDNYVQRNSTGTTHYTYFVMLVMDGVSLVLLCEEG